MNKVRHPIAAPATQYGVTLIELMISMVIGLVLIGAIIAMYSGSRYAYHTSESQTRMLDDARFAMHAIGNDLYLAGSYGRNNKPNTIAARLDEPDALPNLANDCAPGWYIDVETKLFGANDTNPYNTTCIGAASAYRAATDVLVVRAANPTPTADVAVVPTRIYVQSRPEQGRLFNGANAPPTFAPNFNHLLNASAYYVSNFTRTPGDNYPSLRRVTLGAGPQLGDELIAPGVDQFHVQYGVDDCVPNCDGQINYYVDADHPNLDWTNAEQVRNILAVRVMLLMRSEDPEAGLTDTRTYVMGGRQYTPNDEFRRILVSNVFRIRNVAE